MRACCRNPQNWKSQGGRSRIEDGSEAYVKKVTITYMTCLACGAKLIGENVKLVSERIEKKPRKNASRPTTLPS